MTECNCGCGHDHDHDADETRIVTLTLDNDEVIECAELVTYKAGEHEYIALVPLIDDDDDESEGAEVYIYRYIDKGDDQPELENIVDDDEYEIAADAFDEWCDELEYEELGDDE